MLIFVILYILRTREWYVWRLKFIDEFVWNDIKIPGDSYLFIINHYFPPYTKFVFLRSSFNRSESVLDTLNIRMVLFGDCIVPNFAWKWCLSIIIITLKQKSDAIYASTCVFFLSVVTDVRRGVPPSIFSKVDGIDIYNSWVWYGDTWLLSFTLWSPICCWQPIGY
jgi:hypothetical protein